MTNLDLKICAFNYKTSILIINNKLKNTDFIPNITKNINI